MVFFRVSDRLAIFSTKYFSVQIQIGTFVKKKNGSGSPVALVWLQIRFLESNVFVIEGLVVSVDLLYEDRWLFCSWQCSACPSPHPCQELLFVTSRTAGGQISCDMLNLCHKTIICIPTNLDQLLTSKQAKNRSPFDAFRPVEAI